VAVIVAFGAPAVLPAVAATPTIPIVFSIGGDPIKLGIVRSLNPPAGNATGVYLFAKDIEAKRLGLLRDLVPTSALIDVLLNPNMPTPKPSQKTFRRQHAPSVRKFRSCTLLDGSRTAWELRVSAPVCRMVPPAPDAWPPSAVTVPFEAQDTPAQPSSIW
jgi:hypothetical protein